MKTAIFASGLLLALSVGCANAPVVRLPNQSAPLGKPATLILKGDGILGTDLVDLAVLEVGDRTSGRRAPAEALRQRLWAGLPDRLYSPLGLAYVDRQLNPSADEAGFAEEFGAGNDYGTVSEWGGGDASWDASLKVVVTSWDLSRLAESGLVLTRVEVRIFDGASAPDIEGFEPRLLWGADLIRPLKIPSDVVSSGNDVAAGEAVSLLAAEILAAIPARDEL